MSIHQMSKQQMPKGFRIFREGPVVGKPVARFRVYIDSKKRNKDTPYFWCTLYSRLPQARQRMVQLDCGDCSHAAGLCASWTTRSYYDEPSHPDYGKLMPDMGEIVLAMSYSGSSTIAHECSHAAHRYAERVKEFNIEDDQTPEERFALTVGMMTRQIVMRVIATDKRKKAR